MSYRNIVLSRDLGGDVGTQITNVDYFSGGNSLWNIHGLQLRSNAFYRNSLQLRAFHRNGQFVPTHPALVDGNLYRYVPLDFDRLRSKSYAKFRRKLYQGSASLGVTLGSYKQSREMVVKRYQQLNHRASEVIARAASRKFHPKDAASLHLEVVFGWVPLLQDIHSAATTVVQQAPSSEWIKSSAREVQTSDRLVNWSDPWMPVKITNTSYVYHTRGAKVTVTNPNAWLAERAGLLNPASVAWDLVPWSFVINMFVNTGQLVNSITDFTGLTFEDQYQTTRAHGTSHWVVSPANYYQKGGEMLLYGRHKETKLDNAVEPPPLVFKLPKVNWELAAIAASLFTQKLTRVASLVKQAHKLRHKYTE